MFSRRSPRFNRRGIGKPTSGGPSNPYGFGSSLKLWLDATDLSVGALGTWSDKSGNGYDATGVGATVDANWTGGLKQVVLTGASDSRVALANGAVTSVFAGDDQPHTCMFVLQFQTLPIAYHVILGLGQTVGVAQYELYSTNSTHLPTVFRKDGVAATSAVASIADVYDTAEKLVTLLHTGTTVRHYDDGVLWDRGDSAQNVGVMNVDYGSIGARTEPIVSLWAPLDIAEVRMWNVALSDVDRAAEEAALKAKWGTP